MSATATKPTEGLAVDAGVEVKSGELLVTKRSPYSIHPKTAGGMVGTWVAIIALWALHTYAGITPPGEVDAALAGLIAFTMGYIVPSN